MSDIPGKVAGAAADSVTRAHRAGAVASTADYSPCGSYRYGLARVWNPDGPRLAFVMLNPSTATETQNDPTVERCQQRAYRMGFGAVRVVNLFAWRATDPADLRRLPDPVGPLNDEAIRAAASWSDRLIVAWGVHGEWRERGAIVARMLRDSGQSLYHLGLTQSGQPRHPLYLPYERQPKLWKMTGLN